MNEASQNLFRVLPMPEGLRIQVETHNIDVLPPDLGLELLQIRDAMEAGSRSYEGIRWRAPFYEDDNGDRFGVLHSVRHLVEHDASELFVPFGQADAGLVVREDDSLVVYLPSGRAVTWEEFVEHPRSFWYEIPWTEQQMQEWLTTGDCPQDVRSKRHGWFASLVSISYRQAIVIGRQEHSLVDRIGAWATGVFHRVSWVEQPKARCWVFSGSLAVTNEEDTVYGQPWPWSKETLRSLLTSRVPTLVRAGPWMASLIIDNGMEPCILIACDQPNLAKNPHEYARRTLTRQLLSRLGGWSESDVPIIMVRQDATWMFPLNVDARSARETLDVLHDGSIPWELSDIQLLVRQGVDRMWTISNTNTLSGWTLWIGKLGANAVPTAIVFRGSLDTALNFAITEFPGIFSS